LNALAHNQDFAGLKQFAGVNFKEPRGVEDDGRRRWLLRGERAGKEGRKAGQQDAKTNGSGAGKSSLHGYDYALPGVGLSMKEIGGAFRLRSTSARLSVH
jgi:hypothetical protein